MKLHEHKTGALEITPAMIDAGQDAYWACDPEYTPSRAVVMAVYAAMACAADDRVEDSPLGKHIGGDRLNVAGTSYGQNLLVDVGAQGATTWQPTTGLRVRRNIPSDDIIDIEQAWQCLETGEIEWRRLPSK